MIGERVGKDMEGSDRGLFQVLSLRLPEGVRKTEVRIVGILVEIRTEDLPNTSHERYRYTNMFGWGNVGAVESRRLRQEHLENTEEIRKFYVQNFDSD
jgi:hypothetical protein